MFSRFINLLKQDIKVTIRNYFHFVILFLATLMIILINFVIPKNVKLTPNEVFFDNSEGKVLENYLIKQGIDETRIFQSREELEKEVEKNNNSIGIIMEGALDNAQFIIIHQGSESPEILNVLDSTIESTLDKIRNSVETNNFRVDYLRSKTEPIPFNKNMIPVIIVTEAVMLGFFLISVMVFQEKEEGSVKAYRVSPGGTLEYVLSKAVVNVILAVIYSGLVILFTMGFSVNYLSIFLIVILSSFLMTLVGLSVSVFFKNLQEFLFVGVFIIAVAGFPLTSYLSPSFAPSFITWLPAYPVLFGLREVLFPSGKSDFVTSLNLILLAECAVFLVISYLTTHKKLMKEGK
ncbi:ABC transporter permease [Abyssisolibacter fermentans]|uniref:ABC transporter permease n=1 Tax=Abyssisolibacter fermentans TaxID=1766203 RepID=UPI00082AE300|nr:ABC transporter permease [Abyssisolibacter fermentans]